MKGGQQPLGYTIAEVMIVLAITGIMFVFAATFIQGKQERTSFIQGINEYAAQIQGVIDDVQSGQFSDIPLDCTVNGGNIIIQTGTAGKSSGTNPDCTYLGKFIDLAGAASSMRYTLQTVVGARYGTDGKPYADITESPLPQVATQLDQDLPIPDQLVQQDPVILSGSEQNNGFGFLEGLGKTQGSGNAYANGGQTIGMYATNSALSPTNPGADSIVGEGLHAISSARICLSDGTRFGSINIGNQQQLTVTVQIGDTACHA